MIEAIILLVSGSAFGVAVSYLHERTTRTKALEQRIRQARATATDDLAYRALEANEGDALLAAIQTHEHKLEGCGLSLLGDLAMQGREGLIGVLRAFVDARGTTLVYLGASALQPTSARLLLESYTVDVEYMTMDTHPVLATPPFSHRQVPPSHLAYDAVLVRHRMFADTESPASTHIRIRTLEELLPVLMQYHQRTLRWRDAQDPEALLDADLRAIFGSDYARQGRGMARRLAARLPKATLRR